MYESLGQIQARTQGRGQFCTDTKGHVATDSLHTPQANMTFAGAQSWKEPRPSRAHCLLRVQLRHFRFLSLFSACCLTCRLTW